jgi:hypothetical protein
LLPSELARFVHWEIIARRCSVFRASLDKASGASGPKAEHCRLMSTSYFRTEGTGFVPGPEAAGPWSPDMLHGRLFGGLAARAIESEFVADGWRIARLTVDMFRPAGFELVEVETNEIRSGRRIRVADAVITVGGIEVASIRAVVLAEGTPPEGDIWQPESWDSPSPESLPRIEGPDGVDPDPTWDIRVLEGGIASSERSRIWTNDNGLLVDDEPMNPAVRAALSGDLVSPLAHGSDAGIGYINGDYTLAMARYPVGHWVGLDTTIHMASDGIAVGSATLYDTVGPFGTSTATALANPLLA